MSTILVIGAAIGRELRIEQVRDGVQRVLGRPPRSFGQWAADHARDFTPSLPPSGPR